jgi:hypothetical protein
MTEPKKGEFPPRTIEIRHGPRFDVILNLTAENQLQVRDLAGFVGNGIPSSWPTWYSDLRHVDRSEDPQFFAKTRLYSGSDSSKNLLDGNPKRSTIGRKVVNALNSIVSEISLSPRIVEILKRDEVSHIAKMNGFDRIEFVEPLVGLIDRESGIKTLVYRFVSGRWPSVDSEYKALINITEALRPLFKANGVLPVDLGAEQLLIGSGENNKVVYLLDSERYVPQQTVLTSS